MREFVPLRLDVANQCLWRRKDAGDDERIRLTPKAFAVLRYLVEHGGRLVTQDELLNALWPDTFVQPAVLKSHVLEIRHALGDDAKNPRFLETLPKRGHQFVAPVWNTSSPLEPVAELHSRTLVGRSTQIGELRNCWQRTLGNQRQIVFITGSRASGRRRWSMSFSSRPQSIVQAFASHAVNVLKDMGARRLTTQSWKRLGSCATDHKDSRSSRSWPHKFHDLKHTGVSRMRAAGVPIETVIVGWTSSTMAEMAKRYHDSDEAEQRSAVEKMSGPERDSPQNPPQSEEERVN
jgi:DNA-binding winged helix-turn-helix (wHTH) protein